MIATYALTDSGDLVCGLVLGSARAKDLFLATYVRACTRCNVIFLKDLQKRVSRNIHAILAPHSTILRISRVGDFFVIQFVLLKHCSGILDLAVGFFFSHACLDIGFSGFVEEFVCDCLMYDRQ